MRSLLPFLGVLYGFVLPAGAIPNQIGGFLARAESPLNDTEIGDQLLDPALWSGERKLPGNWRAEAPIGTVAASYLAARPRVFGVTAVIGVHVL